MTVFSSASRKNLARSLLLLGLLGIMALGASAYYSPNSTVPLGGPAIHPEKNGKYLALTGLAGTFNKGGQVEKTFSIDTLAIRPKKLSVFSIGRFSELIIDNLSLELLAPLDGNGWLDLLQSIGLEQMQRAKAGESRKSPFLIVEAIINGFTLRVYDKGASVYAVTAAKALFKPRRAGRGMKLLDVVIHDVQSKEVIKCREARLSKDGRLTIPGEYHLASPSGRRTGSGWGRQILKLT